MRSFSLNRQLCINAELSKKEKYVDKKQSASARH
jgi:hypothetical protein